MSMHVHDFAFGRSTERLGDIYSICKCGEVWWGIIPISVEDVRALIKKAIVDDILPGYCAMFIEEWLNLVSKPDDIHLCMTKFNVLPHFKDQAKEWWSAINNDEDDSTSVIGSLTYDN